jgi:hypothetical protein
MRGVLSCAEASTARRCVSAVKLETGEGWGGVLYAIIISAAPRASREWSSLPRAASATALVSPPRRVAHQNRSAHMQHYKLHKQYPRRRDLAGG